MTYTANNPQPGSIHRDGVAIAFTRGDSIDAPKEAERIADALRLIEQIGRMTLTTETECGQCEGSGTTDAMGHSEQCPVCDGSGAIDGGPLEEGAGETLDALIERARAIAAGAACNTPPAPAAPIATIAAELQRRRDAWAAMSHTADGQDDLDEDEGEQLAKEYDELLAFVRGLATPCNTPTKIVIAIEGGLIQGVVADRGGFLVQTVDYDIEGISGSDDEPLWRIPQGDGSTELGYRCEPYEPDVDPAWMEAFEGAEREPFDIEEARWRGCSDQEIARLIARSDPDSAEQLTNVQGDPLPAPTDV